MPLVFVLTHKANSSNRFDTICFSNSMKHSCLSSMWFLLIFYHGILLMCLSTCSKSATVPIFANQTDRLALLDFKNGITQDPLQIMSSWYDSVHFCNWIGVTCSPSNKTVMVLDLAAKRLAGSLIHITLYRKSYLPHWNC